MKKLNFWIILSCTFVLCLSSCRELSTDSKVLLNEVMMVNETNATDEYGRNGAWIELFVKYYGQIDVAGYAIEVVDKDGQAVRYSVPKGDVVTQVQPRQHIMFWADGQPNKGTLHTNFTLCPNQENTLRLYNNNGDLIDELTIPAGTLSADRSYGRVTDTSTEWEVKDDTMDKPITPMAANKVNDSNAKMDNFSQKDPVGIGMAITAMAVVFTCLAILFFAFKTVGTISMNLAKKNEVKAQKKAGKQVPADDSKSSKEETPGDVYAAIGLALHEIQSDVHDIEDMVLTISHDEKHEDSPWSSKALMMRHLPNRK